VTQAHNCSGIYARQVDVCRGSRSLPPPRHYHGTPGIPPAAPDTKITTARRSLRFEVSPGSFVTPRPWLSVIGQSRKPAQLQTRRAQAEETQQNRRRDRYDRHTDVALVVSTARTEQRIQAACSYPVVQNGYYARAVDICMIHNNRRCVLSDKSPGWSRCRQYGPTRWHWSKNSVYLQICR
jgi:hypothetical protein